MNEDGTKLAELRCQALGETRCTWGTATTDYRYREVSRSERSERRGTGQREEAGIGLYYYRARWYDPVLGRFAQADTIVPGGGPLAWDRYAYVSNNPLRYDDWTGHMECEPGPGPCRRSPAPPSPPPQPPAPDPNDPSDSDNIEWRFGGYDVWENVGLQPGSADLGGCALSIMGKVVCAPSADNGMTSPPIQEPGDALPGSLDGISGRCDEECQAQALAGAGLIVATDLFVGLPLAVVIILSGVGTPPAIAAAVLEVVIVLPVNAFGLYLITTSGIVSP